MRISWRHRVSPIRGALRSQGCQASTHILHQFIKSLGLSSHFSSCLRPASSLGRGKRQQLVSIEFSKESALCKKRKPAPNKASKTILTQRKPFLTIKIVFTCGEKHAMFFAFGAIGRKKLHLRRNSRFFYFAPTAT